MRFRERSETSQMDVIGTPAHVLVVENDAGLSKVFVRMLSAEGYSVQTAPDADSAREAIEHQPPDVILLDVMLPGTDGFSMCRCLKDNASTRLHR
jgi:DNA-binding response OmpR family regulator